MSGFMHANGSIKRASKNRPIGNPKSTGCELIFIAVLLALLSILATIIN